MHRLGGVEMSDRLIACCLGNTSAENCRNRLVYVMGGSVAEWLACWTQAQKGPGSNHSRDAVG